MSGFKRNFKPVRKDAAKFVRRRIEKRTHSAGSRVSEVATLLRSSVRDVQSPESPFADDAVEIDRPTSGRRQPLSQRIRHRSFAGRCRVAGEARSADLHGDGVLARVCDRTLSASFARCIGIQEKANASDSKREIQ
jgi:hypothetical protein